MRMTDAGAVPTLGRVDLIWDMETGDPDDFLTLLLLLGHPRVNLIGVTVTPGTPDQVGVVRRALDWFGRDIPVGAFNLAHQVRDAVSYTHLTLPTTSRV